MQESKPQHIRAYVVGTQEEQEALRPWLLETAGEDTLLCFGTVEQSTNDLVSELVEGTLYDCVLFIISIGSHEISRAAFPKVLRDFQKVSRQGIPTFAVFLDQESPDVHLKDFGDALVGPSVATKRFELERIALRLGAAGVFFLGDLSNFSSQLQVSLDFSIKL